MTTEVDICNLALLRLGTRSSIASLSEGSTESNACAQVYPMLRDVLLSAHPWTFATQRTILANLGTPPLRWQYRYAYPNDCLKARDVHTTDLSAVIIPFSITGDFDNQGSAIKVILCNSPDAELTYTARVTNPDLFPAHFIEALGWMIASELSSSLCADMAISQYAVQMATQTVLSSRSSDANEGFGRQDLAPEWIAVRGTASSIQK
jgi:hypothetical protein